MLETSDWVMPVGIEAPDRAGLEGRCATVRAPFALDRLAQLIPEQLVYRLSEPCLYRCTALRLAPLELIDRLAANLLPRRHRHRYHGVLATNSPQRAAHRSLAGDQTTRATAACRDCAYRLGAPAGPHL